MLIKSIVASVFIWWTTCSLSRAFAVRRAKEYRETGEVASKDEVNGIGNGNAEPSCEELKAMWRFSKRQSRTPEVTNEIPTYNDPFSYNIWEPHYIAKSRSIGGLRLGTQYNNRPIYGRIVHKVPSFRIQDVSEKNRAFEEVTRMYGNVPVASEPRRRVAAFRVSGSGHLPPTTSQSGSFQHLKELIKTERARELQEQRAAEELAARTTALKDLSKNGKPHNQMNFRDDSYNYDNEEHDTNHENYKGRQGIMVFPDLLAPASHPYQGDMQIQDYYPHDRFPKHSSSLFDKDYVLM